MKNSCINKRKMILIAIILLIPLVLFSRSGVKSNGKYVIGYDSPERKNGVLLLPKKLKLPIQLFLYLIRTSSSLMILMVISYML